MKAPFRIRNRSLTVALLFIIITEMIERWGLALELLEVNFAVEIVVGDLSGDHILRAILDDWYEVY